jgi:ribosomal protein S18 acetylase RimI-like enzyme
MPTIRRANRTDAAAVAALVNSAYRGNSSRVGWTTEADLLGGQRTDPDAILELLASATETLLLAEGDGGHLLGSVVLEQRPGDVAYLGMLTVRPDVQAQGLGKALLQWGEEYARNEWGATSIEMTVIRHRKELIAWYERRGYVETGERRPFPAGDPRFGLPRVDDLEFAVLRKELARRTVDRRTVDPG